MFDWLKRQFGEGKIRVEGKLIDGSGFIAKVPYIGDLSTLDKNELFETLRRTMLVEHGERVDMTSLKIIGYTE